MNVMTFSIPGFGDFEIEHVVLDVNGTLAVDGVLIDGVRERLDALRAQAQVHLLTADTHGRQEEIDAALALTASRITPGEERGQKSAFVRQLGASRVVAIGNGGNDVGMLEAAAIGIAVLGPEGLCTEAMAAADVAVVDILDALNLLLKPRRLVASLRR
jgi:P-type E1-E2 ATPase